MTAVSLADALRFRLPSFQRKLERARALIADALRHSEHPYVAFSGGKDSLLVLALAAAERPGIVAVWSDDELEYADQPTYIPNVCEQLGATLLVTLGYTTHGGWFTPWSDRPYWREPHPDALHIGQRVETWMARQGYDCAFVGLRKSESTSRTAYLSAKGRLYRQRNGMWQCNPLAGWSTDEVWAAIAGLGLPYNPVYDRLAAIGVERELQRVGPLPLAPGWILQRGWPEMYRDLVARYGQRW